VGRSEDGEVEQPFKLGIDELMDMARTSINVLGNCLATVVIARWEGEFVERPAEAAA